MVSFQSYDDCINWLFHQFPSYQKIGSKAYKPTLENTRKLLSLFDHPENKLKFVHVAGSNGKGSTCAYIASLAKESGYKTGLFTSPHIKDFRERIRVNGEMITESDVNSAVNRIKAMDLDFSPSFFEITLVMALDHFVKCNCDIVILETGLGGRLDATNVVTPEISIITSISLEHQNILGDTLEAIAGEKAGIIKAGIPVVLGHLGQHASKVITERANGLNSKVCRLTQMDQTMPAGLTVDYQKINFLTADTAVQELNSRGWNLNRNLWDTAILNLRENTGFFGRFEVVCNSPLEIWDVSHNVDGIQTTLTSFRKMFNGRMHIVIGLSADKNIKEIVKVIPENAHLFVTEFESDRSADLETLKTEFGQKQFDNISYHTDPQGALKTAKDQMKNEDAVIVLGSFFLFENLF